MKHMQYVTGAMVEPGVKDLIDIRVTEEKHTLRDRSWILSSGSQCETITDETEAPSM